MIKQIVYCGITVASLVLVTKPPLVDAHGGGTTIGVVHSCVATITRGENKKGRIRIIGATGSCESGEAAVDWNVVGARGSIGPIGPTGPAGPQGPKGDPGAPGAAGAQGPQGPAGLTGSAGPTGAAGLAGPAGTAGAVGADGNTILSGLGGPPADTVGHDGDFWINTANSMLFGPKAAGHWPAFGTDLTGLIGDKGDLGPQGAQGATGLQGAQGASGPVGLAGSPGPQGPNGNPGVAGASGPQGSAGPQGITGPVGPAGVDGAAGKGGRTILSGSGDPPTGDGNPGDFWLNIQEAKLFGPKATNGWPSSGVSLKGPTGADGQDGAMGSQGLQGTVGPQGAAGPKGNIGVTGATGATGAAGVQGAAGPTGATGLQGPTGAPGSIGLAGPTGSSGVVGLSGYNIVNGSAPLLSPGQAFGQFFVSCGSLAQSMLACTPVKIPQINSDLAHWAVRVNSILPASSSVPAKCILDAHEITTAPTSAFSIRYYGIAICAVVAP
jgi:collagen type VII alpha